MLLDYRSSNLAPTGCSSGPKKCKCEISWSNLCNISITSWDQLMSLWVPPSSLRVFSLFLPSLLPRGKLSKIRHRCHFYPLMSTPWLDLLSVLISNSLYLGGWLAIPSWRWFTVTEDRPSGVGVDFLLKIYSEISMCNNQRTMEMGFGFNLIAGLLHS